MSLRDKVRDRARARGRSLSAYLIELIEADVGRLTIAEWRERVNQRRIRFRRVKSLRGKTFADLIREERREAGRDE